MGENSKTTNSRSFKSLIASVLIVVSFVAIIFQYYMMLHSETRENIIKSGEINALNAVEEINSYLSVARNNLVFVGYSINGMVHEGAGTQEVGRLIMNWSKSISGVMQGSTSGFYAYVNGTYLDGIGWDPGADYNPLEREWYKQTVKRPGEVVVVAPYVDEYSNSLVVTIAETLLDGKSVIAMDISMERLQAIMENKVTEMDSDIGIILDKDYQVITHSDRGEIGKDYSKESGELGKAVVKGLNEADKEFFSIQAEGKEYMVYAMPLENNWVFLSITDATSAFDKLNMPFYTTVVVAMIIVIILLAILLNSSRKSALARSLSLEKERAIAASKAKSDFLSNMSHEIRTPINAVLGMDEMILRDCKDDAILEYAENIKSAGNTLLGIINDILDLSKIEAGKLDITSADYETAYMIKDLENMIRSRAEDKGLTLEMDIDSTLPSVLYGDELHIKQIITNILTNAVKFTDGGTITFHVGCNKEADDKEAVILDVFVKDTGIGIKTEDIDKLFIQFERLEEERNRGIEGTGLGMSITQSLLQMMGSSLSVESEYGKGSVFGFKLKQKVVKWDPVGDYGSAHKIGAKDRPEYKETFTAPSADLLVVDDNKVNIKLLKGLLKKTQVKIDSALSGDECIVKTRGKKYDLILLDHMMPKKDGIETLHEMREDMDNLNRETPVICLTANAISGSRERYLEEGFNDYLSKPVDALKLEETIRSFIPAEKIKDVEMN